MGIFLLPKASFIMGAFSDTQHTHPSIFILEEGGGGLGAKYARMCVSKNEGHGLFFVSRE